MMEEWPAEEYLTMPVEAIGSEVMQVTMAAAGSEETMEEVVAAAVMLEAMVAAAEVAVVVEAAEVAAVEDDIVDILITSYDILIVKNHIQPLI
jgi:predicted dinucleotide-utilizing enzyme